MNDMTSIAGARILIVDDMPANLGILQKMLESEGYLVLAATSGERALAIAGQFLPDLIILDVMMPGIGGLETCRRLKADPHTQAIPVIFITALTELQDTVDGFQAGAVDYVHKPFQHAEVRARVRTHLQMCSYLNAYRHETDRLRAILNNMGEGLLTVTPDGAIASINPAAQRMLGLRPGDTAGLSLFDLLLPPYDEPYRRHLQATSAGGDALRHGPHEVQLRGALGQPVSLDLTITHVFSSEPMLVCLLHDISAHKRSHDELQRIASTDQLTGMANRRHFDTVLRREWQRAERGGGTVSLAMFDVDYFKGYNDSLGHHAGDHCLQQVAAAIAAIAHRPTDLAARYGGEEFVLVLVDTDAQGAEKLANDARRAVAALALPHPASPAGPYVTVSGGVATVAPAHGRMEDLVQLADAALYRAKSLGRNRIVQAEGA
jgi:diguanylate cyclase (GGDEF)-like protein/PAS domain S-box-containing protein